MKHFFVSFLLAYMNQVTTFAKECTILLMSDIGEEVSDDSFYCQLSPEDADGLSGMIVPLVMSEDQENDLISKVAQGEIISGLSKYHDDNAVFSLNSVGVTKETSVKVETSSDMSGMSFSASSVGDKYFLGVKVHAADKTHPDSLREMSDNIYGTDGDPNNLKSQMFDCSFGQYNIIPGANPSSGKDISEHETEPGMIEVSINIGLEGNDKNTIRNAVTNAVQTLLGFSLPGPFDHVMLILEGCYADCGWAGYAFVNHWLSVYQGAYYGITGVQVHEIGHNLGMAHSGGLDAQTYTDHTCLMGNPSYGDDNGRMCFNPAKSWYLRWYGNDYETFDSTSSSCWSGTLIGIGEWDNGVYSKPVVVKLETGTATDYFVGFNRAAGPNELNDEADDEVTIVETGSNGEAYSQSWLKQHLKEGESYTIGNWRGTGQDLVVTAENIDISTTPGTAYITIVLGGSSCNPPTPAPACTSDASCDDGINCTIDSCDVSTGVCSSTPNPQITGEVEVSVTTDNYAGETSWEIFPSDDPSDVLMSGSGYTQGGTTYTEAGELSCGSYKFVIKDTYGDGICCAYGEGSFEVTVGDTVVAEGGEFSTDLTKTFYVDGQGSPTSSPITSPVTPPTTSPVAPPTTSPVTPPTTSPVTPPTTSPVTPPTTSPVTPPTTPPSNCEIFRFSLTTDFYGSETSFTLVNDLNGKVRFMGGSYEPSTSIVDSTCLANGRYKFTIFDSYGDGICCGDQGDGSYEITLGDDIIGEGGNFEESEVIIFDVGPPSPTNAPTPAPTCLASGMSCIIGSQCCSERCKDSSCN